MRGVSPRIPDPPEPPRPHMISIRLSDEEKANLDHTQELLAKHWKRDKIERADVLRAALTMLREELERSASRK